MTETRLFKGRDGWEAKTDFPINDLPIKWSVLTAEKGEHILRISTSKTRGGIRALASVHHAEGNVETFVIFEDFMKTISTSPARCTEKSISLLQQAAVAQLGAIKDMVVAHYAAKARS